MATKGEEKTELQGTFPGRISRRLSLLLGLVFVVVLLIGGISLLAARYIQLSTQDIERQARHVEVMDGIHAAVHHLISALQQSIITGALYPEDERRKLVAELNVLVEQYAELEAMERDFPEREREMRIYREIRATIAGLLPLSAKLFNTAARRQTIDRRDLEYLTTINTRMPDQAHEMNEIHRIKIKRSIQENSKRMRLILGFYLAFIAIGSLLILGGNILFSKTIVLPIRQLASATREVARGDFRKRVPVSSRDEIGQLSQAFNAMAEKLEEHEEKLKGLAVLEERERIAREMHDSLAQALAYLRLELKAAESLLRADRSREAREALEEIGKVTAEAYEEVRQSILGLRTMVSRSRGLIPTLVEYLRHFEDRTGITVELKIVNEKAIRFPPQVEIQLIRIIQEALSNVWKHSKAKQAWVTFCVEGEFVKILIQDDGVGFDLEAQGRSLRPSFGLETMRERTEGIGGTLALATGPGRGTTVEVRLPLGQ